MDGGATATAPRRPVSAASATTKPKPKRANSSAENDRCCESQTGEGGHSPKRPHRDDGRFIKKVADEEVTTTGEESAAEAAPYRIVTLREWLSADGAHSGDDEGPLPLVDLRPSEQFSECRIGGPSSSSSSSSPRSQNNGGVNDSCVVVNLPLSDLLSGERSPELPPRNVPFAALIPQDKYRTTGNGWVDAELDDTMRNFFFRDTSRLTGKSVKPWRAELLILESDEMWGEAREMGLLRWSGGSAEEDGTNSSNSGSAPLPRLWKPDSLVAGTLLDILKGRLDDMNMPAVNGQNDGEEKENGCAENAPSPSRKWEVWDLGSGAGRDVAFLAEELRAHWRNRVRSSKECSAAGAFLTTPAASFPLCFVGLDNHKASPKRCLPLWSHRGVSDVTESRLADLAKAEEVHESLTKLCSSDDNRGGGVLCLYAVRYLNRKLLRYIAAEERCPLPSGTVFALTHFCKRVGQTTWEFDHPKEKLVLERDELRELFSPVEGEGADDGDGLVDDSAGNDTDAAGAGRRGEGWDVLKDEITTDDDLGRTLIHFVAVKR